MGPRKKERKKKEKNITVKYFSASPLSDFFHTSDKDTKLYH